MSYVPPTVFHCEALVHRSQSLPAPVATHIYGPECEAETGKLMYLCATCAQYIKDWRPSHLNDPIECPAHGRIGTVRHSLILKDV